MLNPFVEESFSTLVDYTIESGTEERKKDIGVSLFTVSLYQVASLAKYTCMR